jgi:hypothetical protein
VSVTRRNFLNRVAMLGPIAMYLWIDPEICSADDDECTLPKPPDAQPLIPDEKTIMARRSAMELADAGMAAELKAFRDAIGKLQHLPNADVNSWAKQIAQHCLNCAPSNGANIHFDWAFLPWHRALLYFLERILRRQSGSDDLRLIYWDWENTQSRQLPGIYTPVGQPLYWKNRKLSLNLTDDDVDVRPLLGVPNFPTFGGGPTQGRPTPAAFGGPHANVHNSFDPGDMADLQFSPRDPVFYAHHANIDRLWSSWVKAGHSNPDFGDSKAYFYDEDKKWRYILFNDLRDEAKLGYKYSSYMQPATTSRPLRTFAIAGRTEQLEMNAADLQELRSAPAGPRFLLIDSIHNLGAFNVAALRYGIFSAAPAPRGNVAEDRNYLGKVATVRAAGGIQAGPLTAALDVTGKLSQILPNEHGSIRLFVAPLDPKGNILAPGIPIQADSINLVA